MEHIVSHRTTPKHSRLSAEKTRIDGTMLITLLAMASMASAANQQQVTCPTEIPQQSIQLTNTPKDWVPYVASPLYLHSAGMAGDSPEKLVTLVGESAGRPSKTGEWSTTFKLEGPYPQGKWLECGYGEYNQIILSKRLRDDIQECKVSYRAGEKAGQNVLKISCK
jgi:hypothetical protein